LAPPRPRRLTVSLPGTAPTVRSRRRRCAAFNAGAVLLIGVRRAPPLPFLRAPIKGSPRALPCPAPASATPLLPHPSSVVKAPPSSPSPVSLPPLLPSPLVVQREIRMACQLRHTTVNLGRHFPTPLAKLSPPLGSPAPPHAKAPTRCPRTGSPAAEFSPADGRFTPPSTMALLPPPPLLLSLACGPREDNVPLVHLRCLPPWAATGPAHSRPRARCAWLGQNPPPAHQS
jgi:hypothetical protein